MLMSRLHLGGTAGFALPRGNDSGKPSSASARDGSTSDAGRFQTPKHLVARRLMLSLRRVARHHPDLYAMLSGPGPHLAGHRRLGRFGRRTVRRRFSIGRVTRFVRRAYRHSISSKAGE